MGGLSPALPSAWTQWAFRPAGERSRSSSKGWEVWALGLGCWARSPDCTHAWDLLLSCCCFCLVVHLSCGYPSPAGPGETNVRTFVQIGTCYRAAIETRHREHTYGQGSEGREREGWMREHGSIYSTYVNIFRTTFIYCKYVNNLKNRLDWLCNLLKWEFAVWLRNRGLWPL